MYRISDEAETLGNSDNGRTLENVLAIGITVPASSRPDPCPWDAATDPAPRVASATAQFWCRLPPPFLPPLPLLFGCRAAAL